LRNYSRIIRISFKIEYAIIEIIFRKQEAVVGYILLEGGAEFGGDMSKPDRRAMALAGGGDARISIIPTAAAPDDNHRRAGENGRKWFASLGATNVGVLPLIDRTSADDPDIAAAITVSQIIYMLGGFPHYLGQTLSESAAWRAMLAAHKAGAIIAGSSAGAMVLCEYYYSPQDGDVVAGLAMVGGACVLPHHNTFGKDWAKRLQRLLPDTVLIGIDEQTGMINDGPDGMWQTYGKGEVTLYRREATQRFASGTPFGLQTAT
jgi:cyanophycinase